MTHRPSTGGRPARALAGAAFALSAAIAAPAAANEAQKLIDDSTSMLRAFVDDRAEWRKARTAFRAARAVVLVPDLLEAGLLLGASGGQCVMAARVAGGGWSQPSFCTFNGGSVGLQLGFRKSETIMFVMNEGTLAKLVDGEGGSFGAGYDVAAGLVGNGLKGAATLHLGLDIVTLSRNQGVYGGLSLAGGWLRPDAEYNSVYYGRPATAREILLRGGAAAEATGVLLRALEHADQADYAERR